MNASHLDDYVCTREESHGAREGRRMELFDTARDILSNMDSSVTYQLVLHLCLYFIVVNDYLYSN
jgi:hypothetical protein